MTKPRKPGSGGTRTGAGRPKTDTPVKVKRTVWITDKDHAALLAHYQAGHLGELLEALAKQIPAKHV